MSVRSDELKAMVDDAWAATEALGSDESDVRRVAFERLLTHLLAGDRDGASPTIGTVESNGLQGASAEPLDGSYATEEQRAWAIAQSFQIGIDEVRDLFDLSDAEPVLQVSRKQLNERKSAATREIVLLVCGARTALGLDTGTDHVREAAEQHGQLDPPNFMRTLDAMEQIALRGSPGSSNRLVRLKGIGVEAARELASKLAS